MRAALWCGAVAQGRQQGVVPRSTCAGAVERRSCRSLCGDESPPMVRLKMPRRIYRIWKFTPRDTILGQCAWPS